jgi:hypothetical protein
MNRRSFGLSMMIVASMLTGCHDNETSLLSLSEVSPPGWLDVRLTGAPGNSEALLFEIVGGPVDSVASASHRVFTNPQTPDQLRVLLVGNLQNNVVARVWVPNPLAVSRYQIVLEQAAAGQGFQQQSVLNYSLKLEAPARR